MNTSRLAQLLAFIRSHHFEARIENDVIVVEIPYTHKTLGDGVEIYRVNTLQGARDVLGY
jgi:hypothetical protein